jgi:dihydrofolate reductase
MKGPAATVAPAPNIAHPKAEIALIWAQARNRAIGLNGAMPWHLPEDLAHFRATTRGHTVVMGRATWDSLPRRPLPGRKNIVVTRDSEWGYEGAIRAASLEVALAEAAAGLRGASGPVVWVIGGGHVYRQTVPLASRAVVTEIDAEPEGDTFAPILDPDEWVQDDADPHWLTSTTGLRYRFLEYRRRANSTSP